MLMSPLDEAVELYFGHLSLKNRSPGTIDQYRLVLYKFVDAHENLRPHEITVFHCRQFLNRWQHRSPSTLAAKVTILRGFFNFLERDGIIDDNPMRLVDRPKQPDPDDVQVVTVSSAQVDRMIAACESWHELLCLTTLAYLGPRLSAAAAIRRGDVDFDEGILKIRREKGGKYAEKPMPRQYEAILRAADENGVWDSPDDYLIPPLRRPRRSERDNSVVYLTVRRVAKRCGIRATTHALRRAFAVRYAETHPGDREALQYLMGHKRAETTERYLQRLNKQKAMERVRDLSWGGSFFVPDESASGSERATTLPETGLPEPLRRNLERLRAETQAKAKGRRGSR